MLVGLLASGCGTAVQGVKIDQLTADTVRKEIHIYATEALPSNTTYFGAITAESCQYLLWDKPASNDDAISQLLFMSKRLGGTGIANVVCDKVEGTNYAKNCWSTIACHALAVRVVE